MSEARQTILVISNDALLCAALRRDLEQRRSQVRVSAVSGVAAAMRIVEVAAPSAILLAVELPDDSQFQIQDRRDGDHSGPMPTLGAAVKALAEYAPIVVMGQASWEPGLQDLIASGEADYVPRGEGCITIAAGLLERRLAQVQPAVARGSLITEDWEKDFAEVLRHELNNPLTGILGNAELLLAEIARRNDGQLPSGGLQRVETIAALAMRMRETVRQLSQQWEARSDGVRSA
jgi:signal transduction histidine kinase